MTAPSLLDATRAALGAAPRPLGSWSPPARPSWMTDDDGLARDYAAYERVLATGDVIWAYAVQANATLFKAGPHDAPAVVVFGSDPAVSLSPDVLRRAASRTAQVKGTTSNDSAIARVATTLADEQTRFAPFDLPLSLTAGFAIRAAVIMIHRAYLPQNHLVTRELPVVVTPARDAVALLHLRFWAADLARQWPMFSVGITAG